MNKNSANGSRSNRAKLRRDAEMHLRRNAIAPPRQPQEDPHRVAHELRVHIVELMLQNEEMQTERDARQAALDRYTRLFDSAPVGYLVLCGGGIIRQVNVAGARLLRMPKWALLERRMGLFIAEQRRVAFADFVSRLAERSLEERDECRRKDSVIARLRGMGDRVDATQRQVVTRSKPPAHGGDA